MRRFRDLIAAANYAQQNDFEIGEHVLEDPQDRWFYVGTQEQLASIPCTDIYDPEQIFEENSQFGVGA